MNLCTCSKPISAIFSHFLLTNPAILQASKLAKKLSIFCSRASQEGSGSTPSLTSKTPLHACLQRVNTMSISLWRQIRSRPTFLLTWSRTKNAWFFASFEAYKMAGFVRRRIEKLAIMRFQQVQRFVLANKVFWGWGHSKRDSLWRLHKRV